MAMKHQALNVGQGKFCISWNSTFWRDFHKKSGFPNFPPALHVMESLSQVPVENHMNNQYCRGFGHAPLVKGKWLKLQQNFKKFRVIKPLQSTFGLLFAVDGAYHLS